MSTKKLLLIVLSLCALQTFGQTNFTFSPEKPKAGDVITIQYTPSGTIANTASPLTSVVYLMRNKQELANDFLMKKTGNNYTGIVKTDTADNLVFFSFSSDGNYDNNSNNGYWIQLYDGDHLKKGSDLSLSGFYQYLGRSSGVESDNAKALKYMEEEFKANPDEKKDNLVSYARLNSLVNNENAPEMIQKEIESLIKSGMKDEKDYMSLQNLYMIAKLPQQSKLVGEMLREKFPDGKMVKGDYIRKFLVERDIVKKALMLDDITSKIKTDASWKYLETSLPDFQTNLVNSYVQNKDWKGMEEAIARYDIKGMPLASLYNNTAWEIQQTDKNLDVAETMATKAVAITKNELKNSGKKPDYMTESQYKKSLENSYAMYADTYAMVMYKLGNYKKGFPYTEEAALKISKGESSDENNTYAMLAEKVLSPKKYVKQLEQFVKDGKSTSTIKDILKRAYLKQHGSDKGYDEYLAVLEKDSYLKMVAELKKGMLSETSPAFTLVDLNGNKVNISDLKNKVVIVDFWATWCGPCKASFPAMQKMVTKYKDDPNVIFVFVDTWETTDKKEKNASDFINANKYDFHVLMDNDSKVVEKFKVTGIPTKFVIDKSGIIRFRSVGFSGSDDKLITELTTMIDMAKSM